MVHAGPLVIIIDRPILDRSHVCVSAGKRGINLQLPVADLIRLTRARVINATAP